jgi:tetratricopeptide (TPR) repeat protein
LLHSEMTPTDGSVTPRSAPVRRPRPSGKSRSDLIEAMLEAALAAQRSGTLEDLLRRHRLAARWAARPFLAIIQGTAGDALIQRSRERQVFELLLRWLVTQLRPDQESHLERIDRQAWLNLTSWRPMLAAMCYLGFAPVPDFRERYRRRLDEPTIDNLCGLWGVGPSTFYRYLDRAKRQMAAVLQERPVMPTRAWSLRSWVQSELRAQSDLADPAARMEWHRTQAIRALAQHDIESALWHRLQAADGQGFIETLRPRAADVAGSAEIDTLIERLSTMVLTPRQQVDLCMTRSVLSRVRNETEREQQFLQQALRIANDCKDPLMLGIATGALGKFHESRDADRAFAYYEESAEFLRQAAPDLSDQAAFQNYLTTLVRLAWLYAARSDPRSRAVLDRAEAMRSQVEVPDEIAGILEQTWGEYWRRAGDLPRALQHKHRALNIFERNADRRSILVTYLNLSVLYGEMRNFERAIDYGQRIFAAADTQVVEPETIASAHVNLGVAHFWKGRYDEAIAHYRAALEKSLEGNLRLQANLAHYNLAESYYTRLAGSHNVEDERLGDTHIATVLAAPAVESTPALLQAARNLKAEVLGSAGTASTDHLLPEEAAVHFEEMAEVHRHRATLAVPMSPHMHVQARLAIARAYLTISMKEREAARQLIDRHHLGDEFVTQVEQLRQTFDRSLSREQRLLVQWKQQANDLLDDQRRERLVHHLARAGSINKSGYGDLFEVSAATASKHLSALAQRGLLKQIGRGPTTRYLLAE